MAALTTLLAEIGAGHTPWKIACRVVSTSNITLSGLQTIDAVALAEGDRVLVAGQTDPKQNGIYLASANTWTRAPDMARSSYAMLGTTVRVLDGATNGGSSWAITSPISGAIRIGVSELAFRVVASGESGATPRNRDTVTNNDAAYTTTAGSTWATREAKTQSGAGTPKAITVAAPADATRSGHKHVARTIPGRVREYLINPDGSFISWLTMDGPVNMTWRADLGAGGRWVADRVYASRQVYRPEDYAVAGPVGIGNATYDDAAWNALRDDFETLDGAQLALLDSQAVIELFGRYETATGWVLRSHWGYSDVVIKGASSGVGNASLQMSALRYTGPSIVRGFNTTIAFNRTNRTLIRSAGSWVTDGVAVGMRILITRGSASNKRLHLPVASISTTTNPNDTLTLEDVDENPVAGFDTTAILPFTEGAVSCDWIQWVAGLELRGAHNTRVEDFAIWSKDNATGLGKMSCGLWISIKPDTTWNESASNNLIQRVGVSGMRNVPGVVGIAIGTPGGSPAIGSQCDTLRLRDCSVQVCIDYGVVSTFTVSGNVLTTAVAHGLVQDEPVRVYADVTGGSAGILPTALDSWTTYYVRYLTTTTLELSLTQGGAAVALSNTGSGNRRISRLLNGSCVRAMDGNNTKVLLVQDCKLTVAGRAVDYELASDGSAVRDCQFDTIGEVAVYLGAAGASVRDCQGERLAAAVWGPANSSPVLVESCSFNCLSNDNVWNIFRGNVSLHRVFAHNSRTDFTVTSVNAGADTISFVAANSTEAPCDNQRVVLRNDGGYHRLPGGVAQVQDYWLGDVTVSGATYTAKLYQASGPLYVVNISSSGSSTTYLCSEVGHKGFDAPAPGLHMTGCTLVNHGRFPRITGTNNNPLWSDGNSLSSAATALPRVYAKGNTASIAGQSTAMADIEPVGVFAYPFFYSDTTDMELLSVGPLVCIEMDWRKLATGSGAASRAAYFPRRCGIKAVWVEVVADDASAYGFGGGTISAATISVGYSGAGTLLPAFDVFAGSFGDNVERRGGFQSSEVGTLLKGADGERITYWPRDVGTTDRGWVTLGVSQLTVDLTLTGGAFSALTQGRLLVYMQLEVLPPGRAL